jgi:hypothetical protein
VLLVQFVRWLAGRLVSDPDLSDAVKSAVGTGMADLRLVGLWLIGYGVIVVAASSASERRYTPRWAKDAVAGWIERRRASTRGRVFLGVAGLVISVMLSLAPVFWLTVGVFVGALWLGYLAVLELLTLVRNRVTAGRPAAPPGLVAPGHRRTVVILVAAVVSAGSSHHDGAAAGGGRGRAQVQRRRRQLQPHAGRDHARWLHNACPRRLYPLVVRRAGRHDQGSARRRVGRSSSTPTRRAVGVEDGGHEGAGRADRSEPLLSSPTGEPTPPSPSGPASWRPGPGQGRAAQQIYLCHNYCEMGAVSFASVLADVKNFVDTHPDDVLTLIIQDATTPADTAAITGGLADHAYTLEPGQDLPTLGDMIDEVRPCSSSPSRAGPAPPWYQKAYDWFQETGYDFKSTSDFSCAPNRGPADAPLFLVNHWVNASPPDPGKAAQANDPKLLKSRLEECAADRARTPNVVAVDFSVRGKIAATVRDVASALRDRARGAPDTTPTTEPPTTSTTSPPSTLPPAEPARPLPTSPPSRRSPVAIRPSSAPRW